MFISQGRACHLGGDGPDGAGGRKLERRRKGAGHGRGGCGGEQEEARTATWGSWAEFVTREFSLQPRIPGEVVPICSRRGKTQREEVVFFRGT